MEMNNVYNSESDKTNAIINIKWNFLSKCTMPGDTRMSSKRIYSAPELENNTNYNDICESWKFDNIPLQSQCSHLSFKLITSKDVTYMRKQRDRKSILLFLEEKILSNISHKEGNKEILLKLLWQIFKFFKEKLFTDRQIAIITNLILSTHSFHLANYWNTAEETYKYFFERILQYTVMDPPKCAEIFTLNQVEMVLEFFHKIYLENIVLLHLVCMTHYCIIIRFDEMK